MQNADIRIVFEIGLMWETYRVYRAEERQHFSDNGTINVCNMCMSVQFGISKETESNGSLFGKLLDFLCDNLQDCVSETLKCTRFSALDPRIDWRY